MFKFQKILFAGAAAAVTMTALASGVCKIDKRSGHTEVLSGKYRLVTSNAKGNFAVSAFSVDGKEYMYYTGLSIKEKGGKVTYNEANTPAGKCTELRADAQEGKIFWQHKYEWDFVNMIRTIETGDYPGFKLTCDIEVTHHYMDILVSSTGLQVLLEQAMSVHLSPPQPQHLAHNSAHTRVSTRVRKWP